MFASNEHNRKRPRRHSTHENDDENAFNATVSSSTGIENKDNNNTPPSHVVCLTGFSPKEKDHYHKLIEGLGGRYTQDLNSSRNTHLVAKAPQGAKYEAALKLNSRIAIVGPLWLEDCHQQQAWIDPPLLHHKEFSADDDDTKKKRAHVAAVNKKVVPDILIPSLKQQLESGESADAVASASSLLFMECQFLLIGFAQEERNLLTSLVGRGCGTIYWELHDSITHVIIRDECDERIRECSQRIALQHPNAPVFVSPWWILACCKHNALQDPSDFEPKYRQPPPPEPKHKKAQSNHHAAMMASSCNIKQQKGNLFRGCMFAFLRVSPPPGTVDYTTSSLESLVSSQNGQLLSSQLVDALKVDLARTKSCHYNSNNNKSDEAFVTLPTKKKKCCYVICWGGGISGGTESVMMMHPLLAQVKRNELADIVEATPIWLQTCCTEQRIVPPQRLGILFQPTAWAIRSLFSGQQQQQQQQKSTSSGKQDKSSDGDNEKNDPVSLLQPPTPLRISVSGFSGSRRTAMIHLIKVMGALYDDSMRTSTTHLICRKASGLKYQKAMEWKLHVVSIDWLYHVAQYGYKGKQQANGGGGGGGTTGATTTSAAPATNPSAVGCEDRFSLPTAPACPSKRS